MIFVFFISLSKNLFADDLTGVDILCESYWTGSKKVANMLGINFQKNNANIYYLNLEEEIGIEKKNFTYNTSPSFVDFKSIAYSKLAWMFTISRKNLTLDFSEDNMRYQFKSFRHLNLDKPDKACTLWDGNKTSLIEKFETEWSIILEESLNKNIF